MNNISNYTLDCNFTNNIDLIDNINKYDDDYLINCTNNNTNNEENVNFIIVLSIVLSYFCIVTICFFICINREKTYNYYASNTNRNNYISNENYDIEAQKNNKNIDLNSYLKTIKITNNPTFLENTCPICLELLDKEDKNKSVYLKNCEHQFHDSCIKEWLKNNNSCPICRSEIK